MVDLSAAEIAEIETNMARALEEGKIEPTIAEKLASIGLPIDELKAALSD